MHVIGFTFFALIILCGAWSVKAHEVWIEPKAFQAPMTDPIEAHFKIGSEFKGNVFPYLPSELVSSGIRDGSGDRALSGFAGDMPAITETPRVPGLHIIHFESKPEQLTFTEPEKFTKYLAEKGLEDIWQFHKQRGLAESGFTEAYSRCAKALVLRGGKSGAHVKDVPVGQTIEWVARENPYEIVSGQGAAMRAQLLWKGKPFPHSSVTVFHHDGDDDVQSFKLTTNADGEVRIPLASSGIYMIDSVHMVPWTQDPDIHWRSYWATLTFSVAQD